MSIKTLPQNHQDLRRRSYCKVTELVYIIRFADRLVILLSALNDNRVNQVFGTRLLDMPLMGDGISRCYWANQIVKPW